MNRFQSLIDLCNHPIVVIGGGISFLLGFAAVALIVVGWLLGITPPLVRLGLGLWRRQIAVFSSVENFKSLKECLVDSKLFRDCNVINLSSNNLEKAKKHNLFLVDWQSSGNEIEGIFQVRGHDQIPLIIYAKPGSIPNETMSDIANRPNTVVVNFRGRLLNDILTSLITTAV